MSTQSFSSVAHHVVGQYGEIGMILVGTYRTGATRLVNGANTRYVTFLNSRKLPLVTDSVKASLINAQTKFANMIEGGIVDGTARVEQAIDLVAGGVNGGIKRAVATVERVESALNTTAITTVGQLTLPVAQVSLAIANRAVEGTKRLSARVIGARSEVKEAVATTQRVVKRTAKKTVGTASKAVRTVKAKAKAKARA
jgi:hypothetical protein